MEELKGLEDPNFLDNFNKRIEMATRDAAQNEDNQISASDGTTSSIFQIDEYIKTHPNSQLHSFVRFNTSEFNFLIDLLKQKMVTHRGMKPQYDLRTRLFLTLLHFSTNCRLQILSETTQIPITTLHRIIKSIVTEGFPVFVAEFIPQTSIPESKTKFQNYPGAVGALDSTTIPHYRPLSINEQRKTFDGKNHLNGFKLQVLVNPDGFAIHCATAPASVHDKRLFDNSGLATLLTTVQGKEVVTQKVLADRGYVGIEQTLPNSLIMQRGDSEEVKSYNAPIAQDRSIVEMWNGRFKKWLVMAEGYRGDRSYLEQIVLGLAALTNFDIRNRPLSLQELPAPQEVKQVVPKTTPTKEKKQKQPHSYNEKLFSKPETHYRSQYNLQVSRKYMGIVNQGSTCHLNVALQLLFSIPIVHSVVQKCANLQMQPSTIIRDMFAIMKGKNAFPGSSILTYTLTTELNSGKDDEPWLKPRSADDSLIDLFSMLVTNAHGIQDDARLSHSLDDNFGASLIKKDGKQSTFWLFMIRVNCDILSCIDELKQEGTKAHFNNFLFFNICRTNAAQTFPIQKELNFSSLSGEENDKFILHAIIAIRYEVPHYSIFKFINNNWYLINDKHCFLVPDDDISCLQGGTTEQCESLWQRLNNERWVSSLLFYARNGEKLF